MESSLLDLPELSIRLEDLSSKLQQTKDAAVIKAINSQILDLMKSREEIYYLINRGAAATGFSFLSREIIDTSQKISALIEAELMDTLEESKKLLISHIDEVQRTISHNTIPPANVLVHFKPAEYPNPSLYFVSYSHKDDISNNIIPIIQYKIGSHVKLWIDKYIFKRHEKLPEAISNGIKESTASLLLLSKDFLESKWCNEEWNAIFMKRIAEPRYHLYIIRIDDEEYPALLNSYYFTDCRNFPTPRARVELGRLLREIDDYETFSRFQRKTT